MQEHPLSTKACRQARGIPHHNVLPVIGKRFWTEDAGLKDILIESGVVAEGSTNGVFSGHHYNRSMRCHKLTFEPLQRLCWEEYLNTLPADESSCAAEMITTLHSAMKNDPPSVTELTASGAFTTIIEGFSDYISLRCKKS